MSIDNLNTIVESDSLLKAVGHPIRLQIILCLSRMKEMTVTDIAKDLSVDQPVASLHLAVLRKINIINVKKQGKQSLYFITDKSVRQAVRIIYHTRKTD